MAGGLIGKAAKLVKGKKTPNKKTRTARNKRKNLVKDMKAEDRQFSGSANLPKPSTQSKKKRSRAKAKSDYNQKLRKADRKDDQKYGQRIPF